MKDFYCIVAFSLKNDEKPTDTTSAWTLLLQDSYPVGQNSLTPKSSKPAAQASLCLGQSRVNTCDGLTVQPSWNGLDLLCIIDRIDKRAPLWCLSNHCELPAVIKTDLVLLLWES